MIRTSYDPEADAMFVWFGPEGVKSVETQEVAPGIMLDLDSERARDRHRGARCERANEPLESRRLTCTTVPAESRPIRSAPSPGATTRWPQAGAADIAVNSEKP